MKRFYVIILAVILIGYASNMVTYVVVSRKAKSEASDARSAEVFGIASEVSCMGYIPFVVRLRLEMTKDGETVAMPGVWGVFLFGAEILALHRESPYAQ